jgi:hypothetical protein
VADPALADDCRTLRIKAFVVRTLSDYESLHSLAELG